MAMHMSIRLAWHDHGWDGHICQNPCNNPFCVGSHSYPGDLIANTRNLDFEKEHVSEAAKDYPCQIACGLSINAFGKDTVVTQVNPPSWGEWIESEVEPIVLALPPATACTWCYEAMYKKDVEAEDGSNQQYDYDKRFKNAKEYFEQFEEGKSLVFYYAGYSNPFSEGEQDNYVVAGISRLKKIDNFHFYENTSESIRRKYAGGFAWQKPITSMYPEEGLCLPYWKYVDDEEVANKLVIKPQNRTPFKYGSREVSNDDAIEVVQQFISAVDILIEIGDDTEDWEERREWLNSVLNELWSERGPYPGMGSVLENIGLGQLIKPYFNLKKLEDKKTFLVDLEKFLEGDIDELLGVEFSAKELKIIRRNFLSFEDNECELILKILPRFDLTKDQVECLIAEDKTKVAITATVDEIIANPYIIFEQYVGTDDADDTIPFYRIDNGVLSSPEYGLEDLADMDPGATERLRALCIDELNWIPAHSFGKAETILQAVNNRLDKMPEWKRYSFRLKNFKIEKDVLEGGLFLRKGANDELYLYIKNVYEDERIVEETFKTLAARDDISIEVDISQDVFKQFLKNKNSRLLRKQNTAEEYERILDSQAEVCKQIFQKPICVLSGAAGTGKTTVIKTFLKCIDEYEGRNSSYLLMAPTGKASERVKFQTNKDASTIHSFLMKHGWLNDNLSVKRSGGEKVSDFDTIIIDESSMVDLSIFATVCRAINWNSVYRLILVGDPNQLPPIGRGRVFVDTIEWFRKSENLKDNVGTLTENIRQLDNRAEDRGTGILDLANVYIQEKQITEDAVELAKLKHEKEEIFGKIRKSRDGIIDKDLSVYFWENQEDLEKIIRERLIFDMSKETCHLGEEDIDFHGLWQEAIENMPERYQIICPYKGEFYGTMSMNKFMQKTFNEKWSSRLNIDGISLYDKVIQIRNRPKSNKAYIYSWRTKQIDMQEVFNGEIATVSPMVYERDDIERMRNLKHFMCDFSGKNREGVSYLYGRDLDKNGNIPVQRVNENLDLAYAISVHKSQGSEFDFVYIVIPKKESHLLSMELLYTALTRAQKHVTIFLEQDIRTLTVMSHVEKSAVRKINSSVFEFKPLPDAILYSGDWYKDEKKLATLSEYFVRSKSEVIIANILVKEEIPFIYEEPLYAEDGSMFLPDFTVTFRGEKYYWEHVGRLDLPNYKAHWEKKEKWYNNNFPGKLITTFESKDLSTEALDIIQKYR